MAVLFAANANAAGIGDIQVNIGEPPSAQNVLLASAEPTENLPRSAASEPNRIHPDRVAAPKPEVKKSARIKKPVVRSTKQKKHKPGPASRSLSGAASRADSKTSGDVGSKNKIKPSDKLSLSLSMTLSIPGNAPTQPGSPTATSNAPQGESSEKERKLGELYAQIAETEKLIKAQQSQLEVLESPSNFPLNSGVADASVAASGMIAQSGVASSVPNIVNEQIKPKMAVPDVQPASTGLMNQIESLEMSWIEPAIGLAVLLLTALGFVRYRKVKAAHQVKSHQLAILNDVHEDTESVRPPAITKTSVPVVDRSMKTPAYTEQKPRSIMPPEYEMLEEADIYLRFGHDKLAEEALREAIRINPRNPQAYLTLSRIYFSHEDAVAFLALAKQIKSLGDEDVWHNVAEMGRSLDPNNSLYG